MIKKRKSFKHIDEENISSVLYYIQKKNPKKFKIIESIIRSVIPNFEKFILFKDEELKLKNKDCDVFFGIKDLSESSISFIANTILLMQPYKPEIIIIDNTEVEYPSFRLWKISDMIRSASCFSEIFITTKSPELLDLLDIDKIRGKKEFKISIINLEKHRTRNSKVFLGHDRGIYVREQSRIDELFDKSDRVKFLIPDYIYLISQSFFEELFFNIANKYSQKEIWNKLEVNGNYFDEINSAINRIIQLKKRHEN